MSTDLAVVNRARADITVGNRGIQITNLDEMCKFADLVIQSKLAPKGFTTMSAVVVALQMGAEVGLTPMASLQNIAVINGRPCIWGDAQLAVCRSSGLFDEAAFQETAEGDVATCVVRRLPNGQLIRKTFSMADAKRAKLAGKDGTWQTYPQRMLQMRARSWALRDAFSDVLRGFYSAEEVGDIPAVSATHTNATPSHEEQADAAAAARESQPKEPPAPEATPEITPEQAMQLDEYSGMIEAIDSKGDVDAVEKLIQADDVLDEGQRDELREACGKRKIDIHNSRGPRSPKPNK